MPITREQLVARLTLIKNELASLEVQIEQLRQIYRATDGARQDVEFWLAEEEKSSSAASPVV